MKRDSQGNIYMEQEEYQEYLAQKEPAEIWQMSTPDDLSAEAEIGTLTTAVLENGEEEIVATTGVIRDAEDRLAEVSLYELNQQLIAQMPEYDDKKWTDAKLIIADWYNNHKDNYYMLLCHECNYYTLFDMTRENAIGADLAYEIQDTIRYVGSVHDISVDTNDMIAVWAKWRDTDNIHCFYLFPYSQGVVHV